MIGGLPFKDTVSLVLLDSAIMTNHRSLVKQRQFSHGLLSEGWPLLTAAYQS